MKIGIVIPYYNESRDVSEILKEVDSDVSKFDFIKHCTIALINDGSSSFLNFKNERIITKNKTTLFVIEHLVNLGQGAALETGFEFFRRTDISVAITMDADGQHSLGSALSVIPRFTKENADIYFGNRFFELSPTTPKSRLLILKAAVLFEKIITGLELTDAHNGLRIISKNALNKLRLSQNGMSHATEIKLLCRKLKLNYSEFPTCITYTQESIAKGQSSLNSLNILRDLLKHYLFGDKYDTF